MPDRPETERRPLAPPVHIRRGSAGRQQTVRGIGGQFSHRHSSVAWTFSGESDVPDLIPDVAAVVVCHGVSDINRSVVAVAA